MSNNSHERGHGLSIVDGNGQVAAEAHSVSAGAETRVTHELDWTIFTARAWLHNEMPGNFYSRYRTLFPHPSETGRTDVQTASGGE